MEKYRHIDARHIVNNAPGLRQYFHEYFDGANLIWIIYAKGLQGSNVIKVIPV